MTDELVERDDHLFPTGQVCSIKDVLSLAEAVLRGATGPLTDVLPGIHECEEDLCSFGMKKSLVEQLADQVSSSMSVARLALLGMHLTGELVMLETVEGNLETALDGALNIIDLLETDLREDNTYISMMVSKSECSAAKKPEILELLPWIYILEDAITTVIFLLRGSMDVLNPEVMEDSEDEKQHWRTCHDFITLKQAAEGFDIYSIVTQSALEEFSESPKKSLAMRQAFEALEAATEEEFDTSVFDQLKEGIDWDAEHAWLEEKLTAYCDVVFAVDQLMSADDLSTTAIGGLQYVSEIAQAWIIEAETYKRLNGLESLQADG